MGKITFTVEGTTVGYVEKGAGVKVEYEVSEEDSGKIIEAMADFYRSQLVDKDGTSIAPTIEAVVKLWFNDCVRQAIRQTSDHINRQIKPAAIEVKGL